MAEPEQPPEREPTREEYGEFLVESARYGDAEDVAQALGAGHDGLVNHADAEGRTALHMAAANGHMAIAVTLLAAGADACAVNEGGNTPLHWAALNGHVAIAEALLEAGGSPFALNKMDATPMDEALVRQHKPMEELIRKWLPKKLEEKGAAQGDADAEAAAVDVAVTAATADEEHIVRPGAAVPADESAMADAADGVEQMNIATK